MKYIEAAQPAIALLEKILEKGKLPPTSDGEELGRFLQDEISQKMYIRRVPRNWWLQVSIGYTEDLEEGLEESHTFAVPDPSAIHRSKSLVVEGAVSTGEHIMDWSVVEESVPIQGSLVCVAKGLEDCIDPEIVHRMNFAASDFQRY